MNAAQLFSVGLLASALTACGGSSSSGGGGGGGSSTDTSTSTSTSTGTGTGTGTSTTWKVPAMQTVVAKSCATAKCHDGTTSPNYKTITETNMKADKSALSAVNAGTMPKGSKLSDADKEWLSQAVHAEPQKAKSVAYERSHTGFVREITVTVADVERLYQERAAG